MADTASTDAASGKLVIKNIGLLLSGDIARPILDADTVVADAGRIVAAGKAKNLDTSNAKLTIDAKGCALSPGLIDSHVHPVFGDWTPRQNQLGWIESFLNGGVTTMISAGEVHLPGRPRDVVGVKALAITAQRAFSAFRPLGVKVHAGAPVLEKGMIEEDFAELAKAGVKLLGEVGLGTVKTGEEAGKMVAWARKYGIQSTIHTGGPSVPGSSFIDQDVVLAADADVIGHINGGHTSLPLKQIECLCSQCGRAIEIVHNGNELAGLHALRIAREVKQLERVILGTDLPAGSGRAAARHPAHDRAALLARRHAGRDRLLLRHRQHGAHPRSRLRADRAGPGGGFRADGPRPAFERHGTCSIPCARATCPASAW